MSLQPDIVIYRYNQTLVCVCVGTTKYWCMMGFDVCRCFEKKSAVEATNLQSMFPSVIEILDEVYIL